MDGMSGTDSPQIHGHSESSGTRRGSRSRGPGSELQRHQCHVCRQVFSRLEHLTRHYRSHSSERSLLCAYCQKGFYRIDALRRHELLHSRPSKGLAKGTRACSNCVDGRRKCSGGDACSECRKRALRCDYLQRNCKSSDALANHSMSGSPAEPYQDTVSVSMVTDSRASSSSMEQSSRLMLQLESQRVEVESDVQNGSNESQRSPSSVAHTAGTNNSMISQVFSQPSSLTLGVNIPIVPTGSAIEHLSQVQPESPDFWQQNELLAMNWSFDDYETYGSSANNDDRYRDPPLLSATALSSQRPMEPSTYNPRRFAEPVTPNRSHGQASGQAIETGASPAVSLDSSRQTNSTNGGVAGHYYVDGDGARLPRIRTVLANQFKRSDAASSSIGKLDSPRTFADGYDFDEITMQALSNETSSFSPSRLLETTFEVIRECFHNTCAASSHFRPFLSQRFPPLALFNHFVMLFLENFQPTLPFVHLPTFDITSTHWLLILAMSAIGSHYSGTDAQNICHPMHEFLRRAICTFTEIHETSESDRILLVQAKLLNCVGLMYSGNVTPRSTCWQSDLQEFYNNQWAVILASIDSRTNEYSSSVNDRWRLWCKVEGLRRLGYCIWLMDCMSEFHFLTRSKASNEDKAIALPCQEVLWEADTAMDWDQLHSCATPISSIQTSLQQIYIEKRLQPSMGEFSRILLIHALFRRTWEVTAYFQQPLTQWMPTAERQRANVISKDSVWLPSIPIYSKWRNSACDCLDVLHWHANSVIGAASGMEHPTVLYLHLARVVLLTPFRDIMKLALLLTEAHVSTDSTELPKTQGRVERWAREDQYKARLAMIHAGVLFWHVRRYSTSSFTEAPAVRLATLALWAYGTFAQHTAIPDDTDEEPPDYPTSMQLDRPADDELVQLFVSTGTHMSAMITGVGNLCSARGPERVLKEGRRLLEGLSNWGFARDSIELFTKLLALGERGSESDRPDMT